MGGEYIYIARIALELIQAMQQRWSSGGVCLVPQSLFCSSRYTLTRCGGAWFGVCGSRVCGPCGPIPEALPWWWWGQKWQPPQSLLHGPVSQITPSEPSSLCHRHR